MILSIHQPAYLPWLGYFDKIARSDTFVFLDTVQFEKNSFINRNRIKTPQGVQWLTVPVKLKGHIEKTLKDTEIDNTQNWRSKHLKAIEMNYKRSKYFDQLFPQVKMLLSGNETNIAELCWNQLSFWLKELNIHTPIIKASEANVDSRKSDLVLDLCRQLKAESYISGALGRGYLIESEFREAGITINYQDYMHPVYPQLWGTFKPFMSVLDFWMNCGTVSGENLLGRME